MQKKEIKSCITPVVKCEWAQINKPNYKFDPAGVYSIDLIFDTKNAEHKAFLEKIESMVEEVYQNALKDAKPQLKKRIQRQDFATVLYDEAGAETGFVKVKLKKNATGVNGETLQIKLFDSTGKEIKKRINIGNGSLVRAKIYLVDYAMPTGLVGVSLKLNAIQIIDLVEYKSDGGSFPAYHEGGYAFEEEEEGEADF